ncbi:hypothetical protein HGRIS_000465 [Hohenbuehelia grisea]|uniref:NADAR domain-containing protein n=1 Tax=Hohenbuehelia grisea TaxID=104357 RepID=A0ABR3JSH8_9AGAR
MRKKSDYIFFRKPTEPSYGFLSPSYPFPFEATVQPPWQKSAGKITFPTVDHWMVFQKAVLFNDKITALRLLRITGASIDDMVRVRQLGLNVANTKLYMNHNKWANNRERIAYEGNYMKFSTIWELHDRLMATREMELVYADPHDDVWGIGHDEGRRSLNAEWGKNLLGKVLEDVRSAIRKNGFQWPDCNYCYG